MCHLFNTHIFPWETHFSQKLDKRKCVGQKQATYWDLFGNIYPNIILTLLIFCYFPHRSPFITRVKNTRPLRYPDMYIFNHLFHCFDSAKRFPKTRVGCIRSSDFPWVNFPFNSSILSPGYRAAFFNVCSKTSLSVEEMNKRKPVWDFVFVMACVTVSSTSVQLKKRQKLFIHPIEFTAVFTHYRFFVLK
jgi:hypothetical protein